MKNLWKHHLENYTPPKINIEPENEPLEEEILIRFY